MCDYVSVDIEASGPIPGTYSMLSLGACLVSDPTKAFYVEFQPISQQMMSAAMQVSGFTLEYLKKSGMSPKKAMQEFAHWLSSVAKQPIFVGCNASFDWQFVNYYFHVFLGKNPFGYTALDMKSMFFGKTHCAWHATTLKDIKQYVAIKNSILIMH